MKVMIIENEDLILEFFKLFGRMEYSLKASGKYLTSDNRNNALADWKKFSSDNNEKFSSDYNFSDSYILENPPKIQKNIDDSLTFEEHFTEGNSDLQTLIAYIKTVRNNLFHGGKGTDLSIIDDNDRNKKLLICSIEILKNCIFLDDDIKIHFTDHEFFLPGM